MSLKFYNLVEARNWNSIIGAQEYSPFFQSLEWGDVEKDNGKTVERYGIFSGKELVGVMQIFEIEARRGHFLHVRHGPVIKKWAKNYIHDVSVFLKKRALEKSASFIRISPLVFEDSKILKDFLSEGYRFSPVYNLDAENRWILPLSQNEDDLLKSMRKTTRYLIKKGEKDGITVLSSNDKKAFDKFDKIYMQTALKKGFIPHGLVRQEYEHFSKKDNARLYLAQRGTRVLAGALIVYSQKSAIYRHGATSEEGRKTPASYLVQWSAIKDAKKRGLKYYDFWGIAKDENKKNPWYGLSSFKKGFGGAQVDYIHSLDLPVSWKYWITFGIDFITTIKKGHFLR